MEHLTRKDLAPYLPFDLTVCGCPYTGLPAEERRQHPVDGILIGLLPENAIVIFKDAQGHKWDHDTRLTYYDFKVYLRPLSHLIEVIEHNGEKFIPIVELVKVANDWLGNPVIKTAESDLKAHTIQTLKGYIFGYSGEGFYIKEGRYPWSVENQLSLFNKLYEWHFDLHDLIGRGLALPKQ